MLHVLFSLLSRDSYGRMIDGVGYSYDSIYELLLPLMDDEQDYKSQIDRMLIKMHMSELIDLGDKDTCTGKPISIKIRSEGKHLCKYLEEI